MGLKIKICGMREEENILQTDALKPDYLGFIFYPPSPRYIGSVSLPDVNAKKAGVFVNEPLHSLLQKAAVYNLDVIQLHGEESPETCKVLREFNYEVWKVFKIGEDTNSDMVKPFEGLCEYFLYDTKTNGHGGSGKKFDWTKLNELSSLGPFLLSGGIGPEDVERIKNLNIENLAGVDVNSRFEASAAVKDIAMLSDFINAIRN